MPNGYGVIRAGGWWGPAAFSAAAAVAGTRLPGYSHISEHVSGLGAEGSPSAPVMVPGFVALGLGQLALGHELRRRLGWGSPLSWVVAGAGAGTIGAGLCPVSDPSCPLADAPEAEPTDARHAAASLLAFVCWTGLPILASRRGSGLPDWHRNFSRALAVPTAVACVAAGATTRTASPQRGLVQRVFLGLAFAWLAGTSRALR